MSFKRLITLLVLVSVLLTGVMPVLAQAGLDLQSVIQAYLPAIPQGFGAVSVDTASVELLEEDAPFLVDVREASEWAEVGYIEGAVNVPVRTLAQNLALLPTDPSTPIIVYCAKGTRGAIAMTALQILGFTNVRNMSGGISAWIDAGLPVVKDEVTFETGEAAAIDPALVAAVDNYLTNVLPQGWGVVGADDLALELVENPPFLLDVREDAEVAEVGPIEGALHIPLRQLGDNLDQLPTDQPIVVYCKSGHRGTIAMVSLQMLGYQVRNLAGGITAWVNAGYEVTGGAAAQPAAFDLQAVIAAYMPAIPQGFGGIAAADLATALVEEPPFLLDVREANEWTEVGHIEGAVNVPVRSLAQNLNLLPANLDAPIVVYCAKGTRGAIAMTSLQVLGFTNVRNLSGGIDGWIAAGNSVVTDEVTVTPGEAAAIDPELVAAVDNYLVNVLPQGWGVVPVADVATELVENPPFLLDVREVSEWTDVGHVDGAINIPLREVAANLSQLPADQPIVVYCKGGFRGAIATTVLQMLGYNARNMAGGIDGWIAAGYPVVGAAEAEEPASETAVEVVLPEGTPLEAAVVAPLAYEAVTTIAMQPGFGTITVDTLASDYSEAFLLDVREPNEYAEGFIAGAVNVPLRTLAQNLAVLPAFDQPIVIYCAAGHRGAIAETALVLLGYQNVTSLRGGIKSYTGPLSQDVPAVTAGEFPAVDADVWATVDAYLSALPAGFSTISAEDLSLALTEGGLFLGDVREASEYAQGFIEGAVNLPMRSFGDVLGELPAQDTPIVVYDSSGHRSAVVMTALQMAGFADVRSYPGGTAAWVAGGMALVTP